MAYVAGLLVNFGDPRTKVRNTLDVFFILPFVDFSKSFFSLWGGKMVLIKFFRKEKKLVAIL